MAASGRRGCDCHHHSDTGAGTNTNEVKVEVDGRPWENGEVDVELGGGLGYHVVIVIHGLCISEMVAAILRRSANAGATDSKDLSILAGREYAFVPW